MTLLLRCRVRTVRIVLKRRCVIGRLSAIPTCLLPSIGIGAVIRTAISTFPVSISAIGTARSIGVTGIVGIPCTIRIIRNISTTLTICTIRSISIPLAICIIRSISTPLAICIIRSISIPLAICIIRNISIARTIRIIGIIRTAAIGSIHVIRIALISSLVIRSSALLPAAGKKSVCICHSYISGSTVYHNIRGIHGNRRRCIDIGTALRCIRIHRHIYPASILSHIILVARFTHLSSSIYIESPDLLLLFFSSKSDFTIIFENAFPHQ